MSQDLWKDVFSEHVDPGPTSQSESNALLCQRRGCGTAAVRGRLGLFCTHRCKAWVYDHPEDDLRKDHFCLRRKGQRQEQLRLTGNTGRVYRRLQEGPATSVELMQAGGGIRFGARIAELRQKYEILAEPTFEPGIWLYTLVENS